MARGAYMTPERIAQAKELLAAYPEKSYAAIGKMMEPPASAATVARVKRGAYDPKPVEPEPVEQPRDGGMEQVEKQMRDISNRVSQVTELQHSHQTKLNAMHDELASLLETVVNLMAMSVQVGGITAQMQADSMRSGFSPKPDYIAKRRDRIAHIVREAVSYAD